MQSKKCACCGVLKNVLEFTRDKINKDGYASYCKDCRKEKRRSARANNYEAIVAKERNRNQSYREAAKKRTKEWRIRNNERRKIEKPWGKEYSSTEGKARSLLRYAVSRGYIEKPCECSACNETFNKQQIHGHHKDYSKPLEVVWLCSLCHGKAHQKQSQEAA